MLIHEWAYILLDEDTFHSSYETDLWMGLLFQGNVQVS